MRIEEGYCPKREDKTHCIHWWEGEECCSCKAPAMDEEAKVTNGMEAENEQSKKLPS